MRVTPQRVIIRLSHKTPSTVTAHAHKRPFLASESKKGSAPGDRGQAKSKRGEWVKQCEIPARDPTQRPSQSSHQRPTVSLQADIKLANYT